MTHSRSHARFSGCVRGAVFVGRSREALRSLCRCCSEWIVGCLWGAKRMIRVISMTAFWVALSAVSAQAQIISNPVLTSWAPYQVAPTYTASPAVTPSACCAPPVVSFCDPCSSAAVPAAAARTAYYAPPGTTYVVAPTTTVLCTQDHVILRTDHDDVLWIGPCAAAPSVPATTRLLSACYADVLARDVVCCARDADYVVLCSIGANVIVFGTCRVIFIDLFTGSTAEQLRVPRRLMLSAGAPGGYVWGRHVRCIGRELL